MGKNLMDDFVKETVIDLEVPNRKGFMYKPSTAGQENDWLKHYWKLNPKTKLGYMDNGELNKCKMQNIVSVPYSIEEITQITGLQKTWEQLDISERWDLLSKLKPRIFNKILEGIEKIDNPPEVELKN